jgi:hypothetical protein
MRVVLGHSYYYFPGLCDKCDPNVISGRPISVGSRVKITRRLGKILCWIKDEAGNEQSIFTMALRKDQ